MGKAKLDISKATAGELEELIVALACNMRIVEDELKVMRQQSRDAADKLNSFKADAASGQGRLKLG